MDKQAYVYIMANDTNTVTYTGVTNDLKRRVYEHKNKSLPGFTGRYNIKKLVYFEVCEGIEGAIVREKLIKGKSRENKIKLITSFNSMWRDLYEEL